MPGWSSGENPGEGSSSPSPPAASLAPSLTLGCALGGIGNDRAGSLELAHLLSCCHQGRAELLQPQHQDTFTETKYSEAPTGDPSSWLENRQLTMSKALHAGSASWPGPREPIGTGWGRAGHTPLGTPSDRDSKKDRCMHSCRSWPGTPHPALTHASQAGTGSRSSGQSSSIHIWPSHESMTAPGSGLRQNPDIRVDFLSNRASGF